jgi:threonine dehydratase
MRWMLGQQGWLAEGGGLVGVAALQSGAFAPDLVTVAVISGGNVDAETVARVLSE